MYADDVLRTDAIIGRRYSPTTLTVQGVKVERYGFFNCTKNLSFVLIRYFHGKCIGKVVTSQFNENCNVLSYIHEVILCKGREELGT